MNIRTNSLFTTLVAVFAIALPPGAQAAEPTAAKPAPAPKAMAQRSFASPEEAAKGLVDAVKAADVKALVKIVGPESRAWLFTGDTVQDTEEWKRFVAAYDEKNGLAREGEGKAVLVVGKDEYAFPAPIVKKGDKWTFDASAGREEVTNRRVGRNELDTIQTLLAVVDAQREYATSNPENNGISAYARRFRSSPGKKDGLFWPVKAGEPPSPLGPLAAQAASEGYGGKASTGKPEPYHGYHFRILAGQGKDAPGGAYDYLVKGKLVGGFAVVAYPSKYAVSGVMTFLVNHDGVVYEKNLGSATPSIAGSMTRFNPDKSWRKSP